MPVEHQASKSRFVVLYEKKEAVLDYVLGDTEMESVRTVVPPQFRGKGVAQDLAKAAFGFAKEKVRKEGRRGGCTRTEEGGETECDGGAHMRVHCSDIPGSQSSV